MKFLVIDFGLFCEHAAALTDNGKNQVYYYSQWESNFPAFDKYIIGEGSGVTKIKNFWEYVDQVDCIVNFDVYNNDVITYLRDKGYRVYGAGLGEILENDRWAMKTLVKKLGLPVNNAVRIAGTPDLREYLKKNKDKYIKIDLFRQNLESFHSKDYKSVEIIIDEMDNVLGPFKDDFEFIVEDAIDAKESAEPGFDGFFNGKEFVKPYLFGYEIEKAFYIGKFTNQLAPQLQNTLDKLTPVLREVDYRGAMSLEEKVVSKDTSYLLDVCARQPAPLSAGYIEWIKNYPELIWKIAGAEAVKIEPVATYVGAMPLESSHANEHWLRILIDDVAKNRRNIKFRQFVKKGNFYYAVPGMSSVVVIVAWGESVDEVYNKIKKLIDKVEAYGLQKDVFGGLDLAHKEIEKGKQLGVSF